MAVRLLRVYLPAYIPAFTALWLVVSLLAVILRVYGWIDHTALVLDVSKFGLNLQVYRLATHPACPWGLVGHTEMGPEAWLPSLLLMVAVGASLERAMGSARYGTTVVMSSLVAGGLSVAAWPILGPPWLGLTWAPAWGPIPGLVGGLCWATWPRSGGRSHPQLLKFLGIIPGYALPWVMLGLVGLLIPGAPTLAAALAGLTGMALQRGASPSVASLSALERCAWARALARVPGVRVVPSHCGQQQQQQSGLPTHRYNPPPGSYPTQPPPSTALPTAFPSAPAMFHGRPAPPAHWGGGGHGGIHGDREPGFHGDLEEEMLRAAIAASLDQRGGGGGGGDGIVEMPQSSVSAFRLCQLQEMGFAREASVLALAAAGGGRVEGAVGLLAHGCVGDDVTVTRGGGHQQQHHHQQHYGHGYAHGHQDGHGHGHGGKCQHQH